MKNITLYEFIAELQKLAVKHGSDEILSIGSSSGKIVGMSSPFCFNFKGHDSTEFVPAYQEDIKAESAKLVFGQQADCMRHVWARVGMTLDITPEEEKAIFEGNYKEGKDAVRRVVMDSRASLDGETYIPEECIQDFDEAYGTNYRDRDEECAWSLDGLAVQASEAPNDKTVGSLIEEATERSSHSGAVYVKEQDYQKG